MVPPDEANREWYFYEGLKNMTQIRDKDKVERMRQDVFVDYADLRDGEEGGDQLPSHLPKVLTLGL